MGTDTAVGVHPPPAPPRDASAVRMSPLLAVSLQTCSKCSVTHRRSACASAVMMPSKTELGKMVPSAVLRDSAMSVNSTASCRAVRMQL